MPFFASNYGHFRGCCHVDNNSDSATTAIMKDTSENGKYQGALVWTCVFCQSTGFAVPEEPKSSFCCEDHKTLICEQCAASLEDRAHKAFCRKCRSDLREGRYRPVGRYIGPSPIAPYPTILPVIHYGPPPMEEPSLVAEMIAEESAIVSFPLRANLF
jgi:ribosomal protein L40E